MKTLKLALISAALLFVVILPAPIKASVISIDLMVPSDGLVSRDTVSGFDWLDVTSVSGLSAVEVAVQVQASLYVTNHGFRFARVSEVETLFRSAGAIWPQYIPGGSTVAWIAPHAALSNLIGATEVNSSVAFSVGYALSDDATRFMRVGLEVYYMAQFAAVRVWELDNPYTNVVYSPYISQGAWLVRSTPNVAAVPIPAPFLSLMFALLSLILLGRRAKI